MMDSILSDMPVSYIDNTDDFELLCDMLMTEEAFGLDVETSLTKPRTLCLIQIATKRGTWLCDALKINVSAFQSVLENRDVVKIIHNASFEKGIFRQFGFDINNVVDTLIMSKKIRGTGCDGGHSLKSVCLRELGVEMDKAMQCSNWLMRPLSRQQLNYAALDAQVLVFLHKIFTRLSEKQENG